MKIVLRPKRPKTEERPRKVSRLGQCNKANRLLRRFYSGKAPVHKPTFTPLIKFSDAEAFY